MFDNKVINLNIYATSQEKINKILKHNQNSIISMESINSSGTTTRRRQLPQIPLEKQQANREKGYIFSIIYKKF
jgi:hypothetical protein